MVVGVVIVAGGIGMTGGFGSTSEDLAGPAPDVARVACQPLATVVRTPVVLAGRDGVRFAIDNASRAQFLDVRSETDAQLAEAPIVPGEVTEAVLTIPPGTLSVTCSAGVGMGTDRSAGTITVVDLQDRWISPELACNERNVETASFEAGQRSDETAEDTARRAVPGLLGSDLLVKPGYPGTLWHGDLLTVVREGEAVGEVTRAQDRGTWNVVVTSCPGTALSDA